MPGISKKRERSPTGESRSLPEGRTLKMVLKHQWILVSKERRSGGEQHGRQRCMNVRKYD